ncbi:MAG: tyrosine-type recombinase/integrase [Pseudomonadota bacterium]
MPLPPKVHKKGKSLYYVHKNKWTRLCPADAPDYEIHGALWRLLRRGADTLGKVIDDYEAVRMKRLKPSTQKDYGHIIHGRLRPHFGHMHPDDLTSQDVAAYLEMREREGAGVRANREIAVLSSIYNHGMRIRACAVNPCYGVRRNTEESRTYYINDESLRLALRSANPGLRHLIWAAYLTGFRQKDLRELTRDNVTPEGLKVMQSKDGKHEIRLWSESLRRLVRRALKRSTCNYVFTNERGKKYTYAAVQSAMTRLKDSAGIDWHFHDIRAKADSDHRLGLGLMRRYSRARKLEAVK